MANVYISLLGTNDYLPCNYIFEGFRKLGVRFVQEATIELCCRDWTAGDSILIFTTDEAYKKNWVNNGHKDRNGNTLQREGLESRLKLIESRAPVKRVSIPEGKDQAEIWQIFQILFNNLGNNDRVVFDVTHAFRSIPLLIMVVLHYAKVMKDAKLEGIYYGAFEALGSDARNMDEHERNAPIFDLTAFDWLLDWVLAVDLFRTAGHALRASQVARTQAAAMGKLGEELESLSTQLARVSSDFATCRGPDLSMDIRVLKERIAACPESHIIPPFKELLGLLSRHLEPFDGHDALDGIRAARFCLDHNLIQQGYTILEETMISYFVNRVGGNPVNISHRQIASSAVTIFRNKWDQEQWTGKTAENPDLTRKYLSFFERSPDLANIFGDIAKPRNDLSHAGYSRKKKGEPEIDFCSDLAALIAEAEATVLRLEGS